MKITHAFRRRKLPKDHGVWGNGSIEEMVKHFPWLEQLVEELKSETSQWSKTGCGGKWTALFFEDSLDGEITQIKLEIKPPQGVSFKIPSIPLKNNPQTPILFQDVEQLVISDMRKNGRGMFRKYMI